MLPTLPIQFEHVTPPVRNDPDRHHEYIASPDPVPPRRCLQWANPLAISASIGGHGVGLKQPRDTNVSAPDTIAKLIRGVVFLAGND